MIMLIGNIRLVILLIGNSYTVDRKKEHGIDDNIDMKFIKQCDDTVSEIKRVSIYSVYIIIYLFGDDRDIKIVYK